jgi:hypothetical protein
MKKYFPLVITVAIALIILGSNAFAVNPFLDRKDYLLGEASTPSFVPANKILAQYSNGLDTMTRPAPVSTTTAYIPSAKPASETLPNTGTSAVQNPAEQTSAQKISNNSATITSNSSGQSEINPAAEETEPQLSAHASTLPNSTDSVVFNYSVQEQKTDANRSFTPLDRMLNKIMAGLASTGTKLLSEINEIFKQIAYESGYY